MLAHHTRLATRSSWSQTQQELLEKLTLPSAWSSFLRTACFNRAARCLSPCLALSLNSLVMSLPVTRFARIRLSLALLGLPSGFVSSSPFAGSASPSAAEEEFD